MKSSSEYYIKLVFIFSFCFTNTNYVGMLKGQIFNAENQLPLAGSNIFINGTDIGTISDEEGIFFINDIPQGYYNISVSYIGYEIKTINDIWIRPNANEFLKIFLNPKILNLESITVENNFFSNQPLMSTHPFHLIMMKLEEHLVQVKK